MRKSISKISDVYNYYYGFYYDTEIIDGYWLVSDTSIYSLDGYDEEFLILVDTMFGDCFDGFTCTNGIVLKYGRELYQDRMHLDRETTYTEDIDDSLKEEFLKSLFEGEFIEEYADSETEAKDITFTDQYGINFTVSVRKDGVVSTEGNGGPMYSRIDASVAEKIFD